MSFRANYIRNSWHVKPIIHSSGSSYGIRGRKIRNMIFAVAFSGHLSHVLSMALEDIGGCQGCMPPPVQFVFNFMKFSGQNGQNSRLAVNSGKSWIHHCIVHGNHTYLCSEGCASHINTTNLRAVFFCSESQIKMIRRT